MTISAKIVLDSINPDGVRLVTMLLHYPRFIHSEFMTHRTFSRNAASSRAIPVQKIIKEIINDPAMPVYWGAAQKGMQASEELHPQQITQAKVYWLKARDSAIEKAERMIELGLHKQIANRILEPWMHMTTLASATTLGNMFNLRVHKDAQPEFQELARQILVATEESEPKQLNWGDWHLPFGDQDIGDQDIDTKKKICTARAARTSYRNFEGEIDVKKDVEMHDKLLVSKHMSPFEHCAQAWAGSEEPRTNFHPSWKQYRAFIPGQNQEKYEALRLLDGISKGVK